ncbi:hypothetical protein OV090_14280 [Nannocystis sp. RBIL2]|uniref:hypothetical protein n=1 Tax=Nannocystis sp. RBIL2 TaxID=2996788 RepID=UPI00226F4242|nr:hypothetical protein [Nannocystis sp. RBIL2]MCY1065944.1 hypothetical protein [Nannocystis sp. RBIL2]
MSVVEPEEWGPEGLCEQFWDIDRKMHNRRFAFILGAGASVQSGIPTAGTLVWRWLGELHRRLARSGLSLERWATAEALEIRGFSLTDAAAFYSQVFARRFRQHPDEGYADLEDIMQGKDPSFGYSVLAHILAETRHKLVITTNFDNLVGDALSIFTGTAPLVCGHESLANFVHVEPRRPVVVKIHRDLLMAPMNQAAEIAALQTAWIEPLTRVFRAYTPIVIGYGGNDGSLMGFLNGLPEDAIPGGLFWCYYGPAGPPGPEIRRLVARHRGVLVPIEGFDELMLRLSARLRIPLLDQVIESKARARVDNYRRRVEELQARLFPPTLAAAEEEEAMPAEQERAEQAREPVPSARPSTSSPLAPSESASNTPAPLPGPAAQPPPPPRRGLESASSARPPPPRPDEQSSPVPLIKAPTARRDGQPSPVPSTSAITARVDARPTPSRSSREDARSDPWHGLTSEKAGSALSSSSTSHEDARSAPSSSSREDDRPVPSSSPRAGVRPTLSNDSSASREEAPPVPSTSSSEDARPVFPSDSSAPHANSEPVLSGRSPRQSAQSDPASQSIASRRDGQPAPVLSGSPPGSPPAGQPAPSTRDVDLAADLPLPAPSEPEAEHVPSDTSLPGANRREPARRLVRPDEFRLADAFAAVDEASELRFEADEPAAPRSWTAGPLQRLPAATNSLQRAMQQVAGEAAAADPWTISLQARAELDRERALALLRAGLEQFPGDRTLSLDLVERLTDAPTRQSVRSALSTIAALLAADPRDKLTLAHLILLLASTDQFSAAGDALQRLRDLVLVSEPSAMETAGLAFLAGLLLRLQGRDDSRALAPFQVHVQGISPIVGLPFNLIADLTSRLDPDSRRLYLHLGQRLAGSLTADELARREPRLAELPPSDPATLDVCAT